MCQIRRDALREVWRCVLGRTVVPFGHAHETVIECRDTSQVMEDALVDAHAGLRDAWCRIEVDEQPMTKRT